MCKRSDFVNFSANISNKSSMIKYDFCFEIWESVDDEVDEQIIDVIFSAFDTDLSAEIEKRDDFDATTERETISVQNICFLDVADEISENEIFETISDEIEDENVAKNVDIEIIAFCVSIDATDDCFDVKRNVAKEISRSEIFEIIFDEITDDVDFAVDSLRDEKVANDVDNAIIALDVSIDAMSVCFAVIVFDVAFANSLDVILTFDAKRSLMITIQKHVDEYSQCFRYAFSFDLNS